MKKRSQKFGKLTFSGRRFKSPFSVAETGFEGGGNGRGLGTRI
jgi:hypothetical protein